MFLPWWRRAASRQSRSSSRRGRVRQPWAGRLRPAVECLEDRVLLNGGQLDPMFGGGGLVLTPPFSNPTGDQIKAVAVQSDGKILVAGHSAQNGVFEFALARYNTTDGALDTSFGGKGTGVVLTAFPSSTGDIANSIALLSDGSIIVAGDSGQPNADEVALAHYSKDGVFDSSFGGPDSNGGFVLTAFPDSRGDAATDVTVDGNGNILVAVNTNQPNGHEFGLLRYSATGIRDTSFGPQGMNGYVESTFSSTSGEDNAESMALDSQGNIIVVGESDRGSNSAFKFGVARYTSSGVLDTSFGPDHTGLVLTPFPGSSGDFPSSVAVDSQDNIVVAGDSDQSSGRQFALVRYTKTGALDTSFNASGPTPGFVLTMFDKSTGDDATSVAVLAGDSIVAAGQSRQAGHSQFALAQYTPAGLPDTNFGPNSDGRVLTPLFSNSQGDDANDMVVQSDGNVVVAGDSQQSGGLQFALARYLETATTDAALTAGPPVAAMPNQVNENGDSVSISGATFQDADPNGTADQFANSTIDWGDGMTTTVASGAVTVTLVSPGDPNATPPTPAQLSIAGSHQYTEGGTFSITIHVVDKGGSTLDIPAGTVEVADAPLAVINKANLTTGLTENGTPFNGPLFTISDEGQTRPVEAGDYTVTINWHDGTPVETIDPGNQGPDGHASYIVTAAPHTFLTAGSYNVEVTVTDNRDKHTPKKQVTDTIPAVVQDPQLTTTGATLPIVDAGGLTASQPWSGAVVSFIDPDHNASRRDFTATINWGDGQPDEPAQVQTVGAIQGGGTQFNVVASHTYGQSWDPAHITVTITDTDNAANQLNQMRLKVDVLVSSFRDPVKEAEMDTLVAGQQALLLLFARLEHSKRHLKFSILRAILAAEQRLLNDFSILTAAAGDAELGQDSTLARSVEQFAQQHLVFEHLEENAALHHRRR